MTEDVKTLVERLRAQAKVHADRAAEMWTAYHTTRARGRPLPWMCRQEEERAATLTEAAKALSSLVGVGGSSGAERASEGPDGPFAGEATSPEPGASVPARRLPE